MKLERKNDTEYTGKKTGRLRLIRIVTIFEKSRTRREFRREDSCRARRLVIHLNGSSTRQAQLQSRQKTVRERAASSYDVRGLCSLLVPSTYSRVLVFSSFKGEKEGLRARVLRHSPSTSRT